MSRFVERGGFWVLGQGMLFLLVIGSSVLWRQQWSGFCATACGWGLLVVGGGVGIAGAVSLGGSLTPFPQPLSRTRLVQGGIYACMRHPLYTAVFCGLVGWAMVSASWPAVLAALASGPFFDAKARREERWLRQLFPEYAAYATRVRRFLPCVY